MIGSLERAEDAGKRPLLACGVSADRGEADDFDEDAQQSTVDQVSEESQRDDDQQDAQDAVDQSEEEQEDGSDGEQDETEGLRHSKVPRPAASCLWRRAAWGGRGRG